MKWFFGSTLWLPLAVFILVGSGCAKVVVSKSDVVGRYLSKDNEFGSLTLRPDGSYSREYSDGSVADVSEWQLEEKNGKFCLTFSDFRMRNGPGTQISGFWAVEVEKAFGRLRLIIDPDLGDFFEKTTP